MSGIDEILPWALDNFPPKDYDTYQEWLEAVSEDFEPSKSVLKVSFKKLHISKQFAFLLFGSFSSLCIL